MDTTVFEPASPESSENAATKGVGSSSVGGDPKWNPFLGGAATGCAAFSVDDPLPGGGVAAGALEKAGGDFALAAGGSFAGVFWAAAAFAAASVASVALSAAFFSFAFAIVSANFVFEEG